MIEWDSYKHIPRMLYCGHTICEICLFDILDSNIRIGKEFFCPSCMTPHINIKTKEDIKNLIKNISLMRICEKLELRKNILSSSIKSSKNFDISFQNSLKINNNNENKNLQNFHNPFLNNKVLIF
jgi:hydrogenase maturation factor